MTSCINGNLKVYLHQHLDIFDVAVQTVNSSILFSLIVFAETLKEPGNNHKHEHISESFGDNNNAGVSSE